MLQILAAFIFFTRLPFWRLGEVPGTLFKRVVPYWPLTGWLTAGLSVAVLYGSCLIFPPAIALLLALLSRVLITGALHEDGLADFIDGFGGGQSRERILAIMKDSHIGTYGVIGLIFYFGFLYLLLSTLPVTLAGSIMLTADPLCKTIAGMSINILPYARTEESAKNKTVYSRMNAGEWVICILAGLIPMMWLPAWHYLPAVIGPVITFLFISGFIRKRIQGYTGDCCGTLFLLCELSFYMGVVIIYNLN